jgi:hypothetical protein
MSETIQARYIQDMPWGAVAAQGNVVMFQFVFKDGTQEKYAFDTELGPLLIGNLHQYSANAAAVKLKGPERAIETAAPYRVTRVARSGFSPDGKIVSIEFATGHGFPISLALTPEQAQQTIEFLQREILLAANPQQRSGPEPN